MPRGHRFIRQLTQEEIHELEELASAYGNSNPKLYRRILVVLLSNQKKTLREIANELKMSKQGVCEVLDKFEREGVKGLLPKKVGARRKFSDEVRQRIVELATQFSPAEFGLQKRYWTYSGIAKVFKRIYNMDIAINSIRKILFESGVNLKQMREKFKKQSIIDLLKS